MAHNLELDQNGQASMFFTGDVPWHSLGRHLKNPATAAEAMEAARLDYKVVKRPLKAIIHAKHYADVPNAFATVRTDTNVVLGVVGSRYQPVQNKNKLKQNFPSTFFTNVFSTSASSFRQSKSECFA
jgi:hypothetical protein